MVGEHRFPNAKAFVLQVFGLDTCDHQIAAVAASVEFDVGPLAGHRRNCLSRVQNISLENLPGISLEKVEPDSVSVGRLLATA